MVFFMRFWKKSRFISLVCVGLFFASHAFSEGNNIFVRSAVVIKNQEEYNLDANFDVRLSPELENVLNRGVTLPFTLDLILVHRKWFFWDQEIAKVKRGLRLSYSALTQQYKVFDKYDSAEINHPLMERALIALGALRPFVVFHAKDLVEEKNYEVQVRFRLDPAGLPSALQIEALESEAWQLDSGWFRWTLVK